MEEKIQKAIEFATEKHKDQFIFGKPYISHPILVFELLKEVEPNNYTLQIAGLLHDTIEDTYTSPKEIAEHFGEEVSSLVVELTDADFYKKQIGISEYHTNTMMIMSENAFTIKLADRLAQALNPYNTELERVKRRTATTMEILKNLEGKRTLNKSQEILIQKFNEIYNNLMQ